MRSKKMLKDFLKMSLFLFLSHVSTSYSATDFLLVSSTKDVDGGIWLYDSSDTRRNAKIGLGGFISTESCCPIMDISTNVLAGRFTIWPSFNNVAMFRSRWPYALKIGGGNWGTLSDRRVKKNIHDFELGLDELLQVKPVYFKYNGSVDRAPDTGEEFVGVIAQDLQRVSPFMVSTLSGLENEDDPLLSVNPDGFKYMLINAIKEQADSVRAMENRVKQLRDFACLDEIASRQCSFNNRREK